eukprot:399494_1
MPVNTLEKKNARRQNLNGGSLFEEEMVIINEYTQNSTGITRSREHPTNSPEGGWKSPGIRFRFMDFLPRNIRSFAICFRIPPSGTATGVHDLTTPPSAARKSPCHSANVPVHDLAQSQVAELDQLFRGEKIHIFAVDSACVKNDTDASIRVTCLDDHFKATLTTVQEWIRAAHPPFMAGSLLRLAIPDSVKTWTERKRFEPFLDVLERVNRFVNTENLRVYSIETLQRSDYEGIRLWYDQSMNVHFKDACGTYDKSL